MREKLPLRAQSSNFWAMILGIKEVETKIQRVEESLHSLLKGESQGEVPELPARDIEYLPISFLKGRIGLASQEGQQKLMHDLANIELQAMELGLRTLMEFPEAPEEFRRELAHLVLQESQHLDLCLKALDSLGGFWGKWPVHLGLWHATHKKDTLLERVFIVHPYLEGSGLDAGDTLLRRLGSVPSPVVRQVVNKIVEEEVGHVAFGSRWFKKFAEERGVDQNLFFSRLCRELMKRHPRRDKVSWSLRQQAGFDEFELGELEELRLM